MFLISLSSYCSGSCSRDRRRINDVTTERTRSSSRYFDIVDDDNDDPIDCVAIADLESLNADDDVVVVVVAVVVDG
jgi:hypothetical protein